ncbi:ring-cleaving dioxygenase [Halobacteriales archaeon SW_7_68_16]|nr:MAG: ring-cleaving dioxygenase [Halobacteriales archaeon SW_7_68_16]
MTAPTPGLHHVTAIAGDPERNARFYVETLGLRFVKRIVNHDDDTTYHFYFGDGAGTPGTTVTFFPWTDAGPEGTTGAGQITAFAYLIRPESVDYWLERFDARDVSVEHDKRFGESVLRITDPDGLPVELVASADAAAAEITPWADGPVPTAHQVRGLHGVTLGVADPDPTAAVLTDALDYEFVDECDGRRRYRTVAGGPGSVVDVVRTTAAGRQGVGTVHHVAFAARDDEHHRAVRAALADHGLRVTERIDRVYFDAIYAREPGGVLFEVATEGPGLDVDESVADLGSELALPDWLEDERDRIEVALPTFEYRYEPRGATAKGNE